MSKINPVDLKGVSQDLIDFKDQVTEHWNYGKYQFQVTSAVPSWTGRQGEMVTVIQNNSGWLYMCTVDESTTWKQVVYFDIS